MTILVGDLPKYHVQEKLPCRGWGITKHICHPILFYHRVCSKATKYIFNRSKVIYVFTVLLILWLKLTTRNNWSYRNDPYQTVLNPILYSEECVWRLMLPSFSIEFIVWLKGLIQLWWLFKVLVTCILLSMHYSSPTDRHTKMFFLWLGSVYPNTSNDAKNIWHVACVPIHAQPTDGPTPF